VSGLIRGREESDGDRRARERRERQEKLKVEIAELDRLRNRGGIRSVPADPPRPGPEPDRTRQGRPDVSAETPDAQERRRQRDERYAREDEERRLRIEERKARRQAELAEEQQADARKEARERERRATSARLMTQFDGERARLVAEAQTAVGRLSSTDWLVDADPLRAHVFALALSRVRSKAQPLIEVVLDVVQKHRTSGRPPFPTEVFVLELGVGNDAANGVATPTFVNFPVDTTRIAELEPGVRARAGTDSLTEADLRPLREALSEAADTLAPTVIHEFTHMALYKAHRNESYPWLPNKYRRNLDELARSLPPGSAQAQKLPKLVELTNPDWERSGLAEEIAELKDFADEATPAVRVICQRLAKYSAQGSELPSHLMEIVYLEGEAYLRQHLPRGHRVLVRLQQQWATHLDAGQQADWFTAQGLPAAGFTDD
jgi:hypothetical protein